jgi:hypothetical protein
MLSSLGLGTEYDDGGIGTTLFFLGMIFRFLGFPYFLTHEYLMGSNLKVVTPLLEIISIMIGSGIFMFFDFVYKLIRKRKINSR